MEFLSGTYPNVLAKVEHFYTASSVWGFASRQSLVTSHYSLFTIHYSANPNLL